MGDSWLFQESPRLGNVKVEPQEAVERSLLKLSAGLPARERRFADLKDMGQLFLRQTESLAP